MAATGLEPWRPSGEVKQHSTTLLPGLFRLNAGAFSPETSTAAAAQGSYRQGAVSLAASRRRAAVPAPDSPRRGHNSKYRSALLELRPSLPFGFRTAGGCRVCAPVPVAPPHPLGSVVTRPAPGGADLAGHLPPWQRGESAPAALPLVAGLVRRRERPPGSSPDPSAGAGAKMETPRGGA